MKYVCICKYVWMFQPSVAAIELILTNEVSTDSSQCSACQVLGDVILNPTCLEIICIKLWAKNKILFKFIEFGIKGKALIHRLIKCIIYV